MLKLPNISQIFSKKPNNSPKSTNENQQESPKRAENKPSAYRHLSGKGLSLAVKAQILGEVPELDDDIPTFYVLREYSRSNSLLVDIKTRELDLPSALASTTVGKDSESASVIFLKHRHGSDNVPSPRLERLVKACLDDPTLRVRLIPVTILWGRAPSKEDSLFRLLMADEWNTPSIPKQLFNISVMGRDTVVQFASPKELHTLIEETKQAGESDINSAILTQAIATRLKGFLDKQRTSIIGPDLSDKRNITGKILASPVVQTAIEQESAATGKSINEVKKEAAGYIGEITSDYSHSVVRFFDHFLTWLWERLYDGVEVRHFERVRELAPDSQIIYVPCHRSHMDYLLLSYVIYKRGLRIPYIAAGDNLNIPVLGEILRSGGAFFMRRSFKGNALYSTVFKEYLHTLMQRAVPIEYFIEGGRSRSGRLLPPKLGMLAMTVGSYLRDPAKPVVFIPTYISYERIMEGATYVGELKGKPKESENLLSLIKTAQKIERVFGTVHLSFGEPLHLTQFLDKFNIKTGKDTLALGPDEQADNDKQTHAMVTNIGVKIMQNINKSAVVNPVSLLALVLLSTPKSALDEAQAMEQIALYQRIAQALPYDSDTFVTDMNPKDILAYGLQLELIERTPHVLGDMIKVADKQAPLLSYFKNNILHVFILASFIASLVQRNGRMYRDKLENISELLYPFLQTELFLKHPQRSIKDTIGEILDVLIKENLVVEWDGVLISAPETNSPAYQQLIVLADPAQQSLERYFMALTLLSEQGTHRLNTEQVVNLCYFLGQRVSVLYADDLPDMFDKALFTSFLDTLVRMDYVQIEPETGMIDFDERIDKIAEHAKYVLNPDMIELLRHTARLNDDEIDSVMNEMNKKRKFGRK
ncbi:glycerol-3-phosphate 1-O-acyltransferase PlsB [Moraxella lacunata]|uniref:Glycerol-3-phosphate acyltransferase n=1 Tax=Moraxella lacunata TaxID=477 RepID=A0A1B8PVC1_MORLA|nr:glycerol-3-phosphate 1-O-acyltransferase PlsB [Moraxella lacunata]MDI4508254.1 glycerol-3-phosphate 1-O-acyltransferase PlsB [Moraxella lacunata]OBX59356.1 glycerol-3-phosphate 1-O-acyltransferase [Moraxella lacunata]OBX59365.1 glycerol-3-phosphate 1-O-acyltransferase [Moraxella lacunata]